MCSPALPPNRTPPHPCVSAWWWKKWSSTLQTRTCSSTTWRFGIAYLIFSVFNHLHLVWGKRHYLFFFFFFLFFLLLATPQKGTILWPATVYWKHTWPDYLPSFPGQLLGLSLCSSGDVHWQFYSPNKGCVGSPSWNLLCDELIKAN